MIVKKRVEFEYDPEADALYIKLNERKIRYSEEKHPGVVVDYDEEGRVIGIELIPYSRADPTSIMKVFHILTTNLRDETKNQ